MWIIELMLSVFAEKKNFTCKKRKERGNIEITGKNDS